ncbi:hypothetical protein GCK72_015592 [Caenorhabditis remanei]|uniref:F-box domain-containing protein n=1 Tax=Caenorhabditis remanei TaxID=31234 RepID=A0A6A5GWY9_CAERE|nr:hypothetical protein GCK72_015592 [Caenorhabditis remanei]KAF1759131.1 hypothetical protein GCK72_015592 [Caenorhabditis remanei]
MVIDRQSANNDSCQHTETLSNGKLEYWISGTLYKGTPAASTSPLLEKENHHLLRRSPSPAVLVCCRLPSHLPYPPNYIPPALSLPVSPFPILTYITYILHPNKYLPLNRLAIPIIRRKKKSPVILDVPIPSSPFPLFHVPNLLLAKIINLIEPKTLVSLSLCSQKSHSVIKTQRKLPIVGRLLVAGDDKELLFRRFGRRNCVLSAHKFVSIFNIDYEGMESVKMGGQQVRIEMQRLDGYLFSYWDNAAEGLEIITDYVTNLFNIDVSEVWASKKSFHIIEHVNSRQKTPLKKIRKKNPLYLLLSHVFFLWDGYDVQRASV